MCFGCTTAAVAVVVCCAEPEWCLMFHVVHVAEEDDWLDFLLTADVVHEGGGRS